MVDIANLRERFPRDEDFPTVALLTPTQNRGRFLPWLRRCIEAQDYPQSKLTWYILDDGSEPSGECVADMPNVVYEFRDKKLNIGAKRNALNDMVRDEDYIVCIDDDDQYPPSRVSHAIWSMVSRGAPLAGASEIHMYYADIQKIYHLGPYGPNHATNGTMAYSRQFKETHRQDEYLTHAEETSFLNEYKEPCVQLDPFRVMLVMSHSQNTFDKRVMRKNLNQFIRPTNQKIKQFIKSKDIREFQATA